MTLSELISHLKDVRKQLGKDRDLPVNITYQQTWPLMSTIGNVRVIDPNADDIAELKTMIEAMSPDDPDMARYQLELVRLMELDEAYVTIADGRSLGYGCRDAWDEE